MSKLPDPLLNEFGQIVMALCKFGHFKVVSKISKTLELGA